MLLSRYQESNCPKGKGISTQGEAQCHLVNENWVFSYLFVQLRQELKLDNPG